MQSLRCDFQSILGNVMIRWSVASVWLRAWAELELVPLPGHVTQIGSLRPVLVEWGHKYSRRKRKASFEKCVQVNGVRKKHRDMYVVWCGVIIKLEPLMKTVMVSPSVNPMQDKIIQMRGKRVMAIIMSIGGIFRERHCKQKVGVLLHGVADLSS